MDMAQECSTGRWPELFNVLKRKGTRLPVAFLGLCYSDLGNEVFALSTLNRDDPGVIVNPCRGIRMTL